MTEQDKEILDINSNELSKQSEPTIQQASTRNGIILGLFALISTGLIAVVHLITKDKIAFEIEAAMSRQLNEIVSSNQYNNDVYRDCRIEGDIELLGTLESFSYRTRLDNKNVALLLTAIAPDGYSGKISLLIGIYENGTIAGVRVTEHQETPGLGDKIEITKSDWVNQFNGLSFDKLSLENWQVKKDGGKFDALTGATITPRAIVKAVKNSLLYYHKHSKMLFNLPSNCGSQK